MCHLHASKVACAYSQFSYRERQLVDAAWSSARLSQALLAWSVRACRDTEQRIFACGALPDFPLFVSEQQVLRDSAAELTGARISDIAVVRAWPDYWPSRQFISRLAEMAEPGADFLIVDHMSGQVERWNLKQIADCDHTRICAAPGNSIPVSPLPNSSRGQS